MEVMWEKLDLVRVYTKPRGQAPDYSAPVVLRRGKCTVEDFCNAIHKEIVKQFRNGKDSLSDKRIVILILSSNGVGNISKTFSGTEGWPGTHFRR